MNTRDRRDETHLLFQLYRHSARELNEKRVSTGEKIKTSKHGHEVEIYGLHILHINIVPYTTYVDHRFLI